MKLLPFKDVRIKLSLLSLMHFATDGLCAYLVFSKLYPENPKMSLSVFIAYNFLAFVTQSPIGMLIDKYNKPKLYLGISASAIILGYAFSGICLLSVVLIGLGNSLFHVAGGKYVSEKSGNDVAHLGIFVSTGAIGLAVGQRYFSIFGVLHILFAILGVCLMLLLVCEDPEDGRCDREYCSRGRVVDLALLAVIAVVFVRAFVGKVASADFEMTRHMPLVIAISTALGKAMGGITSRILGAVPTVVASMSVAAACLTLGCSDPYLYTLGVFAFNFSMPITLYHANILLKGREGFAFGTLAAILMPGYLIATCFTYSVWIKILTAVLCLASAVAVAVISRGIKSNDRSVDSYGSD